MIYKIRYSAYAELHLRKLTARQRKTILDTTERQLIHEPKEETKNRKQMRPNVLAPWELRIGDFRVYYDTDEGNRTVMILAVGIKKRNYVQIGKEILKL